MTFQASLIAITIVPISTHVESPLFGAHYSRVDIELAIARVVKDIHPSR